MHDMATECESHETLGLSNPPVGTTIEELILQSGAAETGQISMAFGRLEAWLDHFWVAWEKRVIENTKPQNFAKISKNYFTLKKAAELSKMNPLKKKKKLSSVKMFLPFWTKKCLSKKSTPGLQGSPWSFRLLPLDHSTIWCHEEKFQWWLVLPQGVKGESTGYGVFLLCFPFPKLKNPRLEVHPRRKGWSSNSSLNAWDLQ